jgi:hypothetical protein
MGKARPYLPEAPPRQILSPGVDGGEIQDTQLRKTEKHYPISDLKKELWRRQHQRYCVDPWRTQGITPFIINRCITNVIHLQP